MKQVRIPLVALLVCIAVVGAVQAQAVSAYLAVEGTKQGRFKGESTSPRWKDWMPCFHAFVNTKMPILPTGQSSGRVQLGPLSVVKPVGGAGPQFLQALATNEILKRVEVNFVRRTAQGTEEVHYGFVLTNAKVVGLRQGVGAGIDQGLPPGLLVEEVAFLYETLEVSHKIAKTMATATLASH